MGVGFGCGVSVGRYGGFMGLEFGCGVSVRGYGVDMGSLWRDMGFPMGRYGVSMG